MALTKIVTNALTDDAVTAAKIADGTIVAADLAANSVDSSELVNGSVDLAHMSVNSIDSDQYVDGSIDLAHMSVNSIDSDQYVDGSIDTAHIADDQVTLAKMAGLARGKIIYGDSSGNPAALAVGSNGQALVSDGTDISWGSGGAISTYTNSTNNRVITSVDSSSVNGEANLTFDGSLLTVAGEVTMTTLDIGGTNVTTTAAELNLIDGGTARGTDALASGDGILINDAGTMKMTNVDTVKTFMQTGVTLTGIDDQSSSNDDQLTITDTAVVINEDSDDLDFRIETNGKANAFYVDGGADKIYMGIAASTTLAAGYVPNFVIEGTGDNDNTIGLVQNSNNNSAPSIVMCKTRGTSVGATTIIQDNDYLGNIYFGGADGSDRQTYGAAIYGRIDGTPGANDMPTELIFATTADGAASPTNRLIISPAGHLTPAANDSYDLGTSSLVWRDIYTGDLNLTNQRKEKGNDIDGTKGSWKIQEGSNDLFIMNQVSGKKYKFNLTEVT